MEKILRQCYKERDVIGANSTVFQNRIASIERILEVGILNDSEWENLTNWMLGIQSKDIEDIFIKLEEIFCEEDSNFSKDKNIKELQILVGVLIYEYSKDEENLLLPMTIVCGHHIGNSKISESLYQLFEQYISEMRISMRHRKLVGESNYGIGISQLKNSIVEKKKKCEEEGKTFSYSVTEIDSIINLLEKCENNFKNIKQIEKYLLDELKAQKEETDFAWWLLAEWSESYNCPLSELKVEEVVLAVSVEVNNLSQYALGPYAVKQMIYKSISHLKKRVNCISLENFVNVVNNKIPELIDLENLKINQVQPILTALKCMNECKDSTDEKAWKAIFEGRSKRKIEDLKMSVGEFTYQLYLELELSYLKE